MAQARSPAEGRNSTGVDEAPSSELFAFLLPPTLSANAATCRTLSPKATCSSLQSPEFEIFRLLICSCSDGNAAQLTADVARFSKRFLLHRIEIVQSNGGWIIPTGDVKLLPTESDQRPEIINKLSKTPFILSPADRGSPYRIFVRRRDGKAPSVSDLAALKDLLRVDAEIERINVMPKRVDTSP